LRGDRVEELTAHRQAEVEDVEQQLAGGTQPGVDVEAVVQAGVVDQTLPAEGAARLFEVHPHDDQQIVLVRLGDFRQPAGVFERGDRVVHRAWSDHNEQSVIGSGEHIGDRRPAVQHDLGSGRAQR
jgi:hypothetical protein